jgi:protein-L-isoaspartate(D-aspartate) O-methyltransferase
LLEAAQMVRVQLLKHGIRDRRVLSAMRSVPREAFVPAHLRQFAYADCPLPIGADQTISQPLMVATMLAALGLAGNERVLDVGTGSGYQAALLGELAREVVSIEVVPALAAKAAAALARLGYDNVEVVTADGSRGWPSRAPYDAIVVGAGAPEVPRPLIEQLAPGGRLVVPVGGDREQQLVRVTRSRDQLVEERLGPCIFVPLVGSHGFSPARTGRSYEAHRPGAHR